MSRSQIDYMSMNTLEKIAKLRLMRGEVACLTNAQIDLINQRVQEVLVLLEPVVELHGYAREAYQYANQ